MKHFIARLLSITGITTFARCFIARDGRFVLLMHSILKRRYSHLTPEVQEGLTVQELDQIIQWVKQHFRLLTPNQFLQTNEPGVLITFDDGYANNYTNTLPLLERHEAPAIFFVCTQHMLEPRNWLPDTVRRARTQWPNIQDVPDEWAWELCNGITPEQIEACAKHPLIEIGSHTITHSFLTQCGDEALTREIVMSRGQLEDITGQTVRFFSYPTGDYNRCVAEAVRTAGYQAGFAVDCRNVGLPLFEIPRVGIYFADPAYLDVKLSGLHRRPVAPGWFTVQQNASNYDSLSQDSGNHNSHGKSAPTPSIEPLQNLKPTKGRRIA